MPARKKKKEKVVYVVTRTAFDYDDNIYSESDGSTNCDAYIERADAVRVCEERNISELRGCDLLEYSYDRTAGLRDKLVAGVSLGRLAAFLAGTPSTATSDDELSESVVQGLADDDDVEDYDDFTIPGDFSDDAMRQVMKMITFRFYYVQEIPLS
jgi:hypothetical protein